MIFRFVARITTMSTKKAGLLCEVMVDNDGIKYISTEYTLITICCSRDKWNPPHQISLDMIYIMQMHLWLVIVRAVDNICELFMFLPWFLFCFL